MADYKMYAFFTAEGEGKAGLTVTITVYNSAGTEMVASGSATGIAGGLYRYTYSNATADDYIGIFKTTDTTVDAKHVPAMVSKQQPMIGDPVALTSAYDAAKTAATQTSVNAIPTTPLLAANYTAPNNTGIGDLVNRLTATRAGYLDKLNVAGTLANTNNADTFKANVSGLMTAAGYTAPDNSGVAAIKAKTDNLPSSPAAVGSAMTLADGAVTAAKIASNAITDAKIATDAISAAKVKADAVTKIQNGLATPTNITAATGVKLHAEQGGVEFDGDFEINGKLNIETENGDGGAVNILNTSNYGVGVQAEGGHTGIKGIGAVYGQHNVGLETNGIGQFNEGISSNSTGQKNIGANKDVDGFDPAIKTGLALEQTLTAMKGAGWTDETLVAILEAIEAIDGGGGGYTPQQIWEYAARTLTSLPTIPTNWLTADGVKADAVTKIQAGLALEATLTAIKGAGWSSETLKALRDAITAVQADLDNPSQYKADVSELAKPGDAMTLTSAYDAAKAAASQSSVNAIPTNPLLATDYTAPDNAGITAIKGKTDNLPAVPAAKGDIPSVSEIATAVWGAVTRTLTSGLITVQQIWENATRTLTASPTDISGLATEANATTNKNTIVTAINNKPVTPVTDTSALAKSSELTPLAKSSELTSLAKTSDLTGLAEKTDIPVDYAKELTLQDVKDQTDQLTFTVPGSVDATAVVDTSALATSAELELVADNVNEIKGKTDQLVFTVPGKVDTDAKIDVSELIDSLLEANIEGSLDLKSTLRIVLAFASGVSEGGGSTTIKYKDLTGLADRIVWTINKSGDRLTSNIDGSDL